jgi:hypothetical protein
MACTSNNACSGTNSCCGLWTNTGVNGMTCQIKLSNANPYSGYISKIDAKSDDDISFRCMKDTPPGFLACPNNDSESECQSKLA